MESKWIYREDHGWPELPNSNKNIEVLLYNGEIQEEQYSKSFTCWLFHRDREIKAWRYKL